MRIAALTLVALIAALHAYIAWFEMFAWQTVGQRVFSSLPADIFAQTTQIAANQGLYNGFLVAGLVWSLLIKDRQWQSNVATCFLIFVALAGLFAAFTVTPRTLAIQTAPALLALGLLYLSARAHRTS
ncbi:MAG: DUF1304 domain-containing protein [Hyphomicrobiales bacterium]|jgi:putative membrane protein